MNIVEVFFENTHSSSFFRNKDLNLKKGLTVLVNTERGIQFGKVIQIVSDISQFEGVDLYDVVRISTKKDYFHYLENIKLGKESVVKCKEIVRNSNLNMTILDGNYNFERTQLLFRFVADERVDFRQLARELGSMFRTRIELRQIGIRDKAKEVGGFGPCGRLLCCLRYENDYYTEMRKNMPKIGEKLQMSQGSGKVVSINLLKRSYVVELDNKTKVEVTLD